MAPPGPWSGTVTPPRGTWTRRRDRRGAGQCRYQSWRPYSPSGELLLPSSSGICTPPSVG